jgi:hypothetical protein
MPLTEQHMAPLTMKHSPAHHLLFDDIAPPGQSLAHALSGILVVCHTTAPSCRTSQKQM